LALEDGGLKPTKANSSQGPFSKILITKGLVEWLNVKALNSSPSTAKKKKEMAL
jgi:hypothetical protein